MADIDIRTLDPADLDDLANLRTLAFGGPRVHLDPATMAVAPDDTLAAYHSGRLVGTVAVHAYHQWFGGRSVPCGGLAGVTIAPDQRGRGLARTLLIEAAETMRARGQVISALYPTTASLYRSLGWEVAGWWVQRSVTAVDLPRPSGAVEWAPADHRDPVLASVYEECARGRDGWIVPAARWWHSQGTRRQAEDPPAWSWVGRRQGRPVAAVAYRYRASERAMVDVDVDLVVGADGPALTDALAFLGASGTTADRVFTTLPESLLVRHVAEASRTKVADDWPWMLRLVDLPGAVAARGWPTGVAAEIHLDVLPPPVADPGGTSGPWVLRVADGVGVCEPGGAGTVAVGAADLAALYAGGVDPTALARDGRLRGADDGTLSSLRAACAGDPALPFFF